VKTKFLAAKTLNEEREREELRSLYLNQSLNLEETHL
jgi:hypothetical protein